eukprot:11333944-Alexandrium_andersonii.AAC.1
MGRQFKREYAGYTRAQVAVDSGAAASVVPGRLLGNREILESEASRKGGALRTLQPTVGGFPTSARCTW